MHYCCMVIFIVHIQTKLLTSTGTTESLQHSNVVVVGGLY